MPFSVGEVSASITGDNTQFNKAIDDAHAKGQTWATQMGQSMQKMGGQMQTLGKQGMMYVTAPILGIGAATFKMANDFESSMSQVVGLVGMSREQVAAWSEELLKMGPALGKTPQELADALYFITSAGLEGAEAMDVLEMSAKASAAGLGETKTVADLVTSAMNAYGSENLSASQATDILVAAVREGKAEASELAAAMGQVLPIASEMGVSFDQVAAAAAAMTRTGTDAATANMQLKNIMMGLLKPTSQAEKALEMMGTSSKELRRQIKDEGLLAVLMNLKELTNEYGEEIMATVFPNIRSLMGVLDLMGANMEDNIEIFDELTNATGALDHAFETVSDTGKFKWESTLAQMQASAIKLGDAVQKSAIPVLEDLTRWLEKVTDWFTNLSEEQQQNIIKWAGITAAIFPVIFIFGTFVKAAGAILSVFGGIGKAIAGFIGVAKGASIAMGGMSAASAVTYSSMGALGVPMANATAGFAGIKTAAGAMGTKLLSLAASGGPILGIGIALGIAAIYWNEYTKAMARDMRSFEQVVEESFGNIMSTIVNNQTQAAIATAKSKQDALQIEIDYYQAKGDLTEEEEERLTELIDEASKNRTYVANLELLERTRAQEEFAENIAGIEAKTNDEIIDLAVERRTALVAELDEETAQIIAEIDNRHAEAGTINSKAHRDEIEAAKARYGERLALINAQLGEELKQVQTELAKRGLVYNEELGKIITIQDQHHRDLQSNLQSDMAIMRQEYNVLSRKNVQEYKRGIDEEAPNAIESARTMGTRSREALKGDGAFEAGADLGNDYAAGIRSQLETVRATANALTTAAKNALKNVEATYSGGDDNDSNTYNPPAWIQMFDSGGIVPGPIGSPQLAVVHGGETILPTHKTNSVAQNIMFSLEGLFAGAHISMKSDQDAKTLARAIFDIANNRARSEGVML